MAPNALDEFYRKRQVDFLHNPNPKSGAASKGKLVGASFADFRCSRTRDRSGLYALALVGGRASLVPTQENEEVYKSLDTGHFPLEQLGKFARDK
jgi:hypothetical protein